MTERLGIHRDGFFRLKFILLVCLALHLSIHAADLMADTAITYSTNTTNEYLEINVTFRVSPPNTPSAGDHIFVYLPHFTRSTYVQAQQGGTVGSDLSLGDVTLHPSLYWQGQWTEGTFCGDCAVPFSDSILTLQLRNVLPAPASNTLHTVVVDSSNNIKAYCGHAANATNILIGTDVTGPTVTQSIITPVMGNACADLNNCTQYGACNHCYNTCSCYDTYSSLTSDCSFRACPAGYSSHIPISTNQAHTIRAGCSNNGWCNHTIGECTCYPGYAGAACERRACPNDCSGHGMCISMARQGQMTDTFPLSAGSFSYGTSASQDTVAWDWETMYGCVCDSEWEVGLGSNQIQASQWFLPDCSRKHCPSGDDPDTPLADEEDCSGISAPGGRGVGQSGNRCYVECSNRGICLYEESGVGRCECFPGYLGENCGTKSQFGGNNGVWNVSV